MLSTYATYIGIDPTAGQKPFTYAALDQDCKLLALGSGAIDDVLAFVGGQRQAYVAVSSPSAANRGVMSRPEVRSELDPPPRPGRWVNFRLSEYQLRLHNISCPQTVGREEDCPNWMRMGFSLYRRLENLGYCPYPASDAPLQWLEVYPHAGFCALLGLTPFPKDTFEGRIQRQLVLFDLDLDVPDPMRMFEEITRRRLLQGVLPMDDLYSPAELDALICAYTAWLAGNQPERTMRLGHPEEGQIVLPVSELKRKYSSAHAYSKLAGA